MVVLDWCYMCKKCRESVYHLFLYCLIAYELWSMVFDLFGTHWVMPYKIIELLVSWQGKFGRQKYRFWSFVPDCLFWREWNARYFEDSERSILDIKSFFFHTLLEWSLVLPSCTSMSLPILLDHCNLGH